MKTDLYTATVPPMIKILKNLIPMLDKAAALAHSRAHEWMPAAAFEEALLSERLIFDQFPLRQQIQVACDNAKNGAARLAGIEPPKFEDTEKTVAELQQRVEKTVAFLETIAPEAIAGQEDRRVSLPYFPGKEMSGFGYATEYLLPNFFFHVVTAYSILRQSGLQIGKADYTGSLPFVEEA